MTVELSCNVFRVDLSKELVVYTYEVSVFVTDRKDKEVDLATKTNGVSNVERRKMITSMVSECMKRVGVDEAEYLYDQAKKLITVKGFDDDLHKIEINDVCYSVELKQQGILPAVDVNMNNDFDLQWKSILEILIPSFGVKSGHYYRLGSGISLCIDPGAIKREPGAIRYNAIRTSTRQISGGMGAVLDPFFVLTYPPNSAVGSELQDLMYAVKGKRSLDGDSNSMAYLNSYIGGALVKPTNETGTLYGRVMRIKELKTVNIHEVMETNKDGERMKLSEMKRFENLSNPNFPVAMCVRADMSVGHYSIERLQFLPYQKLDLLNPVVGKVHTKMNPDVRSKTMFQHMQFMKLDNNVVFQKFGFSLNTDKIHVKGVRMAAPEVSNARVDPTQRNWRLANGSFLDSGRVDILVLLASCQREGDGAVAEKYSALLKEACRAKGIIVEKTIMQASPTPHEVNEPWMREMFKATAGEVEKFEKEKNRRANAIIMFIDPESNKSHDLLKYLEREFEIVTQQVLFETISKMVRESRKETMMNILMKFNKKIGGSNFKVRPMDAGLAVWKALLDDTLVLSADVSREGTKYAADPVPATVGLSCNAMSSWPLAFAGDFAYQSPRQEQIEESILRSYVQHAVKAWMKTRNGRLPTSILYLRDGVSDGQLREIDIEVDYIREAVDDLFNLHSHDTRVRITAAVIVKRHNVRFGQITPQGLVNPLPGTLVDSEITHPDFEEFYMQAHKVIGQQTTAKAPLYRFLTNDMMYSFDQLKSIAHTLCYCHEICTSPTSIPAPVYMADEYAKRGLNMYRQHKIYFPHKIWSSPVDYENLAKQLAYRGTRLEHLRVNA